MKKVILLLVAIFCVSQFTFSQSGLISQGKPASASTAGAGADRNAAAGNDGNVANTRWESAFEDPQWWQVDLQAEYNIARVEIVWEAASAADFKVLVSNDPNFVNGVQEFASVTGRSGARTDVFSGDVTAPIKGRYVRMSGTKRSTGYGYSFFEFRVYGMQNLAPTDIKIRIPVIEYLELALNPADATGKSRFSVQNTDYINKPDTVVTLKYYPYYTALSIDVVEFRGDWVVDFESLKEGSTTEKITGIPQNWVLYPNQEIKVVLTKIVRPKGPPTAVVGRAKVLNAPASQIELDGSGSRANGGGDESIVITGYRWEQVNGPVTATIVSPNTAKTNVTGLTALGDYRFRLTVTDNEGETGSAELLVTVEPPEVVDFELTYPNDKVVVYNTRKPILRWNACSGATKYEVYVNITRDDYDWYAPGNMLDRYTKVGETTTNSFTMPNDMPDRWTYKWYVLATTPQGIKYSSKRQFGLYMPVLETRNDGVNLITKDNLQFRDMNKNGQLDDYEDWRLTPEVRVADLVGKMSLEEKFKQLFFSDAAGYIDGFNFSYGPGNSLIERQEEAAKTPFGIPTAFSGDKIAGLLTIYPTQLGMAATQDVDLMYRVGSMQRREFKETGFTGTLGPLAEVSTAVLYNRIHEGGGENAEENTAMLRALLCGMQGGPEVNPSSMLVTVKHWPSQGAGGETALQYDATTIKYHMKPWHAVVECNAASVMPGYSSAPFIGTGGANDSKAIIDYLRNEIEFDGFIMTDWLGVGENSSSAISSMGAGIDVMGGAASRLSNATTVANAIGADRITESARRVLEWKIRAGQFENPYGKNPTFKPNTNNSPDYNAEHHNLALEAARKVVTLVTNKGGVLPLKLNSGDEMVVGGPRSRWMNRDNDPNVIWQAIYYENPQVKTYVQTIKDKATPKGIKVFQQDTYCSYGPEADTNRGDDNYDGNPKVAVLFIGERSGTHGSDWGDNTANISQEQLDVLRKYKNKGAKVVTVVLMQRPYVLTEVNELSDAVLCVYRGGNGITQAVAECLFGEVVPTGRLPFQIPRSMDQIGTKNTNNQIEKWDIPYDLGATQAERDQIKNYIAQNIPIPLVNGMTTFGDPLFQYGHGLMAWGATDNTPPVAFDLTAPANNATIKDQPSVTFTWQASSDPESGVSYDFYLDGAKKTNTSATTYTTTVAENGEHTWYVNAVNGAGLIKKSTSERKFTIEKTVPTVDTTPPAAFNLTAPANDATIENQPSVTFTWEASSDAESGVASYILYINDAEKATITAPATTYTADITTKGAYTWYVKAVNGDGLTTETSARNFTIERTESIQINKKGEVKVYPNPFKDEFTVDLQGVTGINQLKVLDATGKTVMVKTADSNVNIDLSNRQPGLYILFVEGNDGSKVMKLMKK